MDIYRHPEKIHGQLGPVPRIYNVLRIYNVSMDIQRYSMDALLVCTTVYTCTLDVHCIHGCLVGLHYCTCTSDISMDAFWLALLYMYFGYTLYPWISRDIPWMPCWFALLYIHVLDVHCIHGCLVGLHYCTCTSDIQCIHRYPEIFHGWLVGLHYCTCTSDVHCIHGWLVATVHVLRIYNVSMDIQRYSMDAFWLALLYMYFGYTMYPWISRDIPWMPCWFALLYIVHVLQMYIESIDGLLVCTTVHVLRMYNYMTVHCIHGCLVSLHYCTCTSDIQCIHGYPEIFHGCLVGLHYCTCTCTSDIYCIHGYQENDVLWTCCVRWEIITFNLFLNLY